MVDMKRTYAFCKNANINKRIPAGSILKGGSNSATKYFAIKIKRCLLANSDVCYCSKSGIPQDNYKRGYRGLIRLTKVIQDLNAAMNPPVSTPPIVTQPSNATAASSGTTTAPSTTSGPPGSLGPTVASESASNKKYPERPLKLERLSTDKRYSTEDGEQLPLTLYGERREAKSVFLDCIQVGSVLKLKGLSHKLATHWPSLSEGDHWVWFTVDVPYGSHGDRFAVTMKTSPQNTTSARTKPHTRKQKRRYLTWSGFIQIAMRSRSPVAKKFQKFVEETIFVCSNGSSAQRRKLGAQVSGVPLRVLEQVLAHNTNSMTAIYLHQIKTVADARRDGIKGKSIKFHDEVPGDHVIVKIGKTDHMRNRTGQHRRDHKTAENPKCLMYAVVNTTKLKSAEDFALTEFADCNLNRKSDSKLKEYFVFGPEAIKGKHNKARSIYKEIGEIFNMGGGIPESFRIQMNEVEKTLVRAEARVQSEQKINLILQEQIDGNKEREQRQAKREDALIALLTNQ